MHDTRTRHCLGKLLSISGVNQGKGARSRPRTMGAWVSNASSNDTGAPPIEAYINANVPVYAYIITYILTSLSFCLFLFPPLPPLLSVPFFSLERIQWFTWRIGDFASQRKHDGAKGRCNAIGVLLSVETGWNFRIDEASVLQTFRFFSSFHLRMECRQDELYCKNVKVILYEACFLFLFLFR